MAPIPSDKDRILKIITDQPDDSSFDEILRELAFMRMVEKGLDSVVTRCEMM